MKIIPLNEGAFAVDKQKNFVAINSKDSISKTLKMAVCPFLIVLENDMILLDAGLGFETDCVQNIKLLLQKNGFEPEQITKVLLSHLHKDHADGLGYFRDGKFIQNFKNATIYIQKKEMEFALSQRESPSFNQKTLEEIKDLPNIVWLDSEEGQITENITYLRTGGHSPFHQAFWVGDGAETAFYGADNLPQKGYLKFHLAYKTDDDGKKAMALREIWEKTAKKEHWTV
jgi:glyoxylase-like metal-dependent hydrolase (beta-lactamase superfamily II)